MLHRRSILRLACLVLIGAFTLPIAARSDEQIGHAQAVVAKNGMVVAQEATAARIGADILRQGGNAVDAAVAVGFALAVTYPRAGNLGGGGFMLIHQASGNDAAIDYRETAPAAITNKTFLDADGNANQQKSRDSALAIGVPGTVEGLAFAARKYGSGRFQLADLIAPALALARDGMPVTDDIADMSAGELARLKRWPSSAKIFLKPDGTALALGGSLVQSDLANTLEAIAKDGPRAFYNGPIADAIAAAVQAAGGVMTAEDLQSYTAFERAPVRGTYRGYDIVSMPPPSSGGVELIEMLNILEGFDLGHEDGGQTMHLMVEAMKRAYADRALFLGDPDQIKAPIEKLISKDYGRLGAPPSIRSTRRRPAPSAPGAPSSPKAAIPRISPWSTVSATRCPTPIRSISATASGWSRRAPVSFSTTSSTISP
jgi:gamma-glutamyltranspeptidase/glutathione hydrolase